MSTKVSPQVAKVVLIGDSGTGKTSFMERYMKGTFSLNYKATIGVDFTFINLPKMVKNLETPSKKALMLQMWDVAGRERFVTVTRSYYRGAVGFLILYDITNRDSFGHVKQWCDEINNYQGPGDNVKIIIGTKRDVTAKRQVSFEEADELAKHLGVQFFEVSAKEDINISEAMDAMTAGIDALPQISNPTAVTVQKPVPTKETSGWSFRCNIL